MKKKIWKLLPVMLLICLSTVAATAPKVMAADPEPNIIKYIPEEDMKLPEGEREEKAHEIHWLSGIKPPMMPNEITKIDGRTEKTVGRFSKIEHRATTVGGSETHSLYYVSPYIPNNGWYDINKTVAENAGTATQDSNLCFAVAMTDMIHWWMNQNRDYIHEAYLPYLKQSPENAALRERILHYADNLNGQGIEQSVLQTADTSNIYKELIYEHYKDGPGGYPDKPADYFFNGYAPDRESRRNRPGTFPGTNANDGGLFYDVFGKSILTDVVSGGYYEDLNQNYKTYMDNGIGTVISIKFSIGAHALAVWGAEYDEKGNLCAVYLTDNNDNGRTMGEQLKDQGNQLGSMIRYGVFKYPESSGAYLSTEVNGAGSCVIYGSYLLTLARDGWKYWTQNNYTPMYKDGRAFMRPAAGDIDSNHEYIYEASENKITRTCKKCEAEDWVAIVVKPGADIYNGQTLSPCDYEHTGINNTLPFNASKITYEPGNRIEAGTIIKATISFTNNGETYTAELEVPIRPQSAEKPSIAPQEKSVTADTVSLVANSGYEYSCSAHPDEWRADGKFTGLQPNTEYTFRVRKSAKESNNKNYAPSEPSDQTLTVTTLSTGKKHVTVSGISAATKSYDGQPAEQLGAPSFKVTGTDQVVEPKYTIQWQTEDGKVLVDPPKDAGSYQLVVSVGGDDEEYYGESKIGFKITKATVTVKAEPQTIEKGHSPEQNYIVDGLVNGEKLIGAVQLKYLGSNGALIADISKAPAGTYRIVPYGAEVPSERNYNAIIYQESTLKINESSNPGGGGTIGGGGGVAPVPPTPGPEPEQPKEGIIVTVPKRETADMGKDTIDQILNRPENSPEISLKVETKEGTVEYDGKALDTIAQEIKDAESMSATVKDVTGKKDNMTAQQQNIMDEIKEEDNSKVISVTLGVTKHNGTKNEIHDFKGGRSTITVPYKAPENAKVMVYRLEKDGSKTAVDSTYDAVNGTLSFVTPSHSFYVIRTENVKNGWDHDQSGWFFLEKGKKVTGTWRKDSTGWCYLGKDGYMVTNSWAQDSHGWCYLDANGHQKINGWARDSVDWCYVENGYMVTNRWAEDSKGWLYIGHDGRIVHNLWVRDSRDWCYLDQNGYMLKNRWVKDSAGWCYIGNDGRLLRNGYASDSMGRHYLDKSGHMAF